MLRRPCLLSYSGFETVTLEDSIITLIRYVILTIHVRKHDCMHNLQVDTLVKLMVTSIAHNRSMPSLGISDKAMHISTSASSSDTERTESLSLTVATAQGIITYYLALHGCIIVYVCVEGSLYVTWHIPSVSRICTVRVEALIPIGG